MNILLYVYTELFFKRILSINSLDYPTLLKIYALSKACQKKAKPSPFTEPTFPIMKVLNLSLLVGVCIGGLVVSRKSNNHKLLLCTKAAVIMIKDSLEDCF